MIEPNQTKEPWFPAPSGLTELQHEELASYVGKMFSDNYSNTGSSVLVQIDRSENRGYYQECYSQYGNITGKNVAGNPRTDRLRIPAPGLRSSTLSTLYGRACGWK